ncbi:hypothetical protein BGZ63DRAFT_370332 [Mariannaea sp. PMI_226]|nr:hypothetical protein BGZ63DRAFT_370332 [Mariannaea sp. PMI_226]
MPDQVSVRVWTEDFDGHSTIWLPASEPQSTPTLTPTPVIETTYQVPGPSGSTLNVTLSEKGSSSSANSDVEPTNPVTTVPTNTANRGLSNGIIAVIIIGSVLIGTVVVLACVWIRGEKRRTLKKGKISPMYHIGSEDGVVLDELMPQEIHMATPDPNAWFAQQAHWNPRESLTGVRSPTPKPAVAEVRSFTRAAQKPRICDVGKPQALAQPGSRQEHISSGVAISTVSPISSLDSGSPIRLEECPPSERLRVKLSSPSTDSA